MDFFEIKLTRMCLYSKGFCGMSSYKQFYRKYKINNRKEKSMKKYCAEFFGTFGLVLGGWAIAQLWLFWVAPIAGALVGAAIYRVIGSTKE